MTRVRRRRCWVRGRGLGSRRSVSSCRLGCRGTTTSGGVGVRRARGRRRRRRRGTRTRRGGEERGSLLINGRPQQEEGVGVGVGGAGAGVSIQHGILAARPASCTRARTQTHALRLPVLAEGEGRGWKRACVAGGGWGEGMDGTTSTVISLVSLCSLGQRCHHLSGEGAPPPSPPESRCLVHAWQPAFARSGRLLTVSRCLPLHFLLSFQYQAFSSLSALARITLVHQTVFRVSVRACVRALLGRQHVAVTSPPGEPPAGNDRVLVMWAH